MAEFSVSLADPRFTRAVTAYQSLRRALHSLGLEDDERLQDALAIIEETLVLGALRASMPHVAERRLHMEAEEQRPEAGGHRSRARRATPAIEGAAGTAARDTADETESGARRRRVRMRAAAGFLESEGEALEG